MVRAVVDGEDGCVHAYNTVLAAVAVLIMQYIRIISSAPRSPSSWAQIETETSHHTMIGSLKSVVAGWHGVDMLSTG